MKTLFLAILAVLAIEAQTIEPGAPTGGGSGGVTSVTGSAGVTCTPTTGAVGCSLDTSIADTRTNAQANQDNVISDSTGSDAYACLLTAGGIAVPTLGSGTIGSLWQLIPTFANTGAATCQGLNILRGDGSALADNDILASVPTFLYQYSATVFRTLSGPGAGGVPTLSTQGVGFMVIPWQHHQPSNGVNTFTNTIATPNYWQIEPVGFNIAVRSLNLNFSTATGSASAGTAIALYDSSCNVVTNGRATSKIINAATGVINFVFATPPVLLANTVYYYGMATEQTGQQYGQIFSNGALWQETSFPRSFTGNTAATGTGTGLTMPSSCGTKSASNASPISMFLLP